MEKYTKPVVDVEKFEAQDVVTASPNIDHIGGEGDYD